MAEHSFPNNSQGSDPIPHPQQPAQSQEREKKVEPIEGVTFEVKKPTLGQRFKKTFFSGSDAKQTGGFVWNNIVVPMAKNAFLDVIQQGSERMVWGEARSRTSTGQMLSSQILGLGHQAYNKMYNGPMPGPQQMMPQQLSAQARATHNFSEFVVPTRVAAEMVIDRMFDLLQRDGVVTVADFYDLIGNQDVTYTDQQWGWVNLQGSQVVRVPQGYLIDIPRPISLKN